MLMSFWWRCNSSLLKIEISVTHIWLCVQSNWAGMIELSDGVKCNLIIFSCYHKISHLSAFIKSLKSQGTHFSSSNCTPINLYSRCVMTLALHNFLLIRHLHCAINIISTWNKMSTELNLPNRILIIVIYILLSALPAFYYYGMLFKILDSSITKLSRYF